jgi:hypothetical protein
VGLGAVRPSGYEPDGVHRPLLPFGIDRLHPEDVPAGPQPAIDLRRAAGPEGPVIEAAEKAGTENVGREGEGVAGATGRVGRVRAPDRRRASDACEPATACEANHGDRPKFPRHEPESRRSVKGEQSFVVRRLADPSEPAPPSRRRARLSGSPLFASRELAGLPLREHAVGVGVAAAAGVSFGRDQHVLAEGREVAAAEGAAIGGGLAVLRPAHRPPARRGHRLAASALRHRCRCRAR